MSSENPRRAAERQLWRCLEAVHAAVYFAPDVGQAWRELGLKGFWMGYFASRSAALGRPGAQLVTALFHGFAPRMVERALPGAWDLATPQDVLATRARIATAALAPHTGGDGSAGRPDRLDGPLDGLLDRLDLAGRPLAAAHAALPRPGDPVTRLWHAATVLREYRGDGHVAALVAADVDGAAANVWHAAGGLLVDSQRDFRGWTAAEWDAARAALHGRGWLAADGTLTAAGGRARDDVEHRTDLAAARALRPLSDGALADLLARLHPIAASVVAAGAVPYPNAMGVPAPDAVPPGQPLRARS
ncbi:SCO6745 family protein [Pseudonocardia sp.]|uniref:SCO6745 family protein n=1 Tax=Pseudonocardia sp. TaxID=60912 RepID=UPI003D0FE72A